jgi:hypothetical protein
MVSANSAIAPTLEAIKYKPGNLEILDQLSLPHETKYVQVPSEFLMCNELWLMSLDLFRRRWFQRNKINDCPGRPCHRHRRCPLTGS